MSLTEALYATFASTIARHNLITPPAKILIGISGGPDSLLLLHFLKRYAREYTDTDLVAAHYLHYWDTQRTEEQKILCQQICDELHIPLHVGSDSQIQPHRRKRAEGSQEAHAREQRRAFFEKTAHETGCSLIALAHHQDDQIETLLIRLIRGTSLYGLGCIRYKSEQYIRPLLDCTKKEILKVMEEQGLQYHNDTSNSSDCYLRNKLRNNVTPALIRADSRAVTNIAQTVRRLQESIDAIDMYIKNLYAQLYDEQTHYLKKKEFLCLDIFTQKQLLTKILIYNGFQGTIQENNLNEIIRFLNNKRGRASHTIGTLHIVKIDSELFEIKNNLA